MNTNKTSTETINLYVVSHIGFVFTPRGDENGRSIINSKDFKHFNVFSVGSPNFFLFLSPKDELHKPWNEQLNNM